MSRVRSKNRRGRASNRSDSAQRPHITKNTAPPAPGFRSDRLSTLSRSETALFPQVSGTAVPAAADAGARRPKEIYEEIYEVTNVSATAFKPMRRGPGSLAYDACEMYDVFAVERMLMKTALARRCPELNVKLDMDLPWSRLDGSFCRRYEAAAVAKRAHFNQNPFAMLKHPSGP